MAEEATAQQPLEKVGEPQPESEEAAWTQQSESLEKKISEPQRPESEKATPILQPVSMEKTSEPQPQSEEATSTQQSVSMEKASEPQPESEEITLTHQPESWEKVYSKPQQPESEEATSTQQPESSDKASEPQQAESEEATSTQQPVSLEKVSEPQKVESEEATSMTTPTQQPESLEKVSEPQQAESGKETDSHNGEGWVTAYEHTPANVRVAPEVDNCPFCRIVVELARAYEVYRDQDFVCFEDRSPVSTLHYLLVPRKHYRDLRSLTMEHLPMLARMVEVAKIVLKERNGDPDDVRMGFHLPPFLRVPHLHMHIISPASRMSWLNRNIVFRNDSFAFVSPAGAINSLKKSSKN